MAQIEARLTWGPVQNPVRGVLHGSAAIACLLLARHLWVGSTCGSSTRLAIVVFALSQVCLFTASALYHSVPWTPPWKRRLQRIDHSMIYVKIAGTMTPILWLALDDWRRPVLLGAAWAIAFAGIFQKALLPNVHERASIPVQILQAMLVLPALAPFAERFPGAPVRLLLFGAALYVIGVVAFLTERPRMWPRVFSFHELFHVLIVAASGAHSTVVLGWLARP